MSKEYKKVRDNKNYMFAEFRSKKEYQEEYKSVINNTLNADQFELVVFIERLRTTMLIERESNGKK